ncbi:MULTISPECIES: hypothetical protein [unclassified Streptomyces]|uniref:Uncharacterized protein n=1 Tax=Streptomyces sp. NBC_00060 TaxID=2975636 RepID=A0AAU2H2J4_9ACTN
MLNPKPGRTPAKAAPPTSRRWQTDPVAELSPALLGSALLVFVAFVCRLPSHQVASTAKQAKGGKMDKEKKARSRGWWGSVRSVVAGLSEGSIGALIFEILTGQVVTG